MFFDLYIIKTYELIEVCWFMWKILKLENFEKNRWLYIFYFYYCNWGLKFQFIPVVFLKVFFIKMRKIIGLVVFALSVSLINSVLADANPYSLIFSHKM